MGRGSCTVKIHIVPKIQEGGGRHFEISQTGITLPILNRFAPNLTERLGPGTFLLSNLLFDKIKNGSGRHIEIHIYGHNLVSFARNFAHRPTQIRQIKCIS